MEIPNDFLRSSFKMENPVKFNVMNNNGIYFDDALH